VDEHFKIAFTACGPVEGWVPSVVKTSYYMFLH
jgi:hypothetical protein